MNIQIPTGGRKGGSKRNAIGNCKVKKYNKMHKTLSKANAISYIFGHHTTEGVIALEKLLRIGFWLKNLNYEVRSTTVEMFLKARFEVHKIF